MKIIDKANEAKGASIHLSALDSESKNRALEAIAVALEENKESIIKANNDDYQRSEKEGIAGPILKRLKFGEEKINDVISGIRSLITLKDPVGETVLSTELEEGLNLYRVTCPIGVIGIIFESRPDALVQISTLALKSGNSVLLKGGSEAAKTNKILFEIINKASMEAGVPKGWIQLVETRADVNEMFALNEQIDLLIPRGSNAFVKYIMENSNIPVLGHADGVCHIYIDNEVDSEKIIPIVVDAKTQYVAACNTVENILVNKEVAEKELPAIVDALKESGVEVIGCEATAKITGIPLASDDDWTTEYVDYKVSIKTVDDLGEAIDFINKNGSGHTDAILTENSEKAKKFMALVDSACVFQNCSTRFSDGFRFGFGAEVGISTSKIHSRGPVGLDGLLIYKYKLLGNGQTVTEFSSGKKSFTHKALNSNCPY